MKTKSIIILILILSKLSGLSQSKIPNLSVEDLKGKQVNLHDIIPNNEVVVLSFWATWCKPCINEQNAVNDNLPDWEEEAKFKYIAISVDDSRSVSRVKSMVKGKDWEFDVYIDSNQKLKRSLGITGIPHTIVIDKTGKIVWEHSSYKPGDEEEMFEIIKKYSSK